MLGGQFLGETLDEQVVVLVHVASLSCGHLLHVWEGSAWLLVNLEILHGLNNFLEFFVVIDSNHGSIERLVNVSLNLWLIDNFVVSEVLDLGGNGD